MRHTDGGTEELSLPLSHSTLASAPVATVWLAQAVQKLFSLSLSLSKLGFSLSLSYAHSLLS